MAEFTEIVENIKEIAEANEEEAGFFFVFLLESAWGDYLN